MLFPEAIVACEALKFQHDSGEDHYCHSEQREQKELAIDQRFFARFEAELRKIPHG